MGVNSIQPKAIKNPLRVEPAGVLLTAVRRTYHMESRGISVTGCWTWVRRTWSGDLEKDLRMQGLHTLDAVRRVWGVILRLDIEASDTHSVREGKAWYPWVLLTAAWFCLCFTKVTTSPHSVSFYPGLRGTLSEPDSLCDCICLRAEGRGLAGNAKTASKCQPLLFSPPGEWMKDCNTQEQGGICVHWGVTRDCYYLPQKGTTRDP